ncbi:MAG TPA: PP2C family protein-serine/threonine phosphatase [Bryobacteraceae bacterium]|nr:PP2C family protein-serine/threonine phosphatase [Bryobacteraceae bacterium]
MKLRKYSQLKFGVVLGIGALVALVLCVQCVRTYLYTGKILVPQQAERDAARQAGALSAAARSAGIANVRDMEPIIEHAIESAADRILWIRVLDLDGNVFAQGGNPQVAAKPPRWLWNQVEKHDTLGVAVDTPEGKAWVVTLPFRLLRPPRADVVSPKNASHRSDSRVPTPDERHKAYVLEVAISLKAVANAFEGLRQNLVIGLIASFALLASVAVIGLRAPHYFRGKYLESELQLARRVQSDLQPKPDSVSPHLDFAAFSLAADHVGGDFYDIFEVESGKIAIVLGDVSGKGVPAALLVSVLHGAIRSSTSSQHELACERINRMLCERTACERFATLFWGVFDPATRTLRYVNAGHAAPMLIRRDDNRVERLDEGGPVLGLLSDAQYIAGTVKIDDADTLLLYSDGISEAANQNEHEFGDARIEEILSDSSDENVELICHRIMNQVTAFSSTGVLPDDRTLLVVKFQQLPASARCRTSQEIVMPAVA